MDVGDRVTFTDIGGNADTCRWGLKGVIEMVGLDLYVIRGDDGRPYRVKGSNVQPLQESGIFDGVNEAVDKKVALADLVIERERMLQGQCMVYQLSEIEDRIRAAAKELL